MFLTYTSPSRLYLMSLQKNLHHSRNGTKSRWYFNFLRLQHLLLVGAELFANEQTWSLRWMFTFAVLYTAQVLHWSTMQGDEHNTCRAIHLKCHHENLFLLLHIMNLNFTRLEKKQQLSVECKQQYLLKLLTWYIFVWLHLSMFFKNGWNI